MPLVHRLLLTTRHAVPIENIKELREGADARFYRQQFQIAATFEDRWLTIVYVLDGRYKTLHLLAPTYELFQMWDLTLRRLYGIRQRLMTGLGHTEVRQAVWEKQFWKGDSGTDQRLEFEEVERMCRRLNINPSTDDLLRRFKVDTCSCLSLSACSCILPIRKPIHKDEATSTFPISNASSKH